MNVNYLPPLKEQIKGHHETVLAEGEKPVAIKVRGRFLQRVDPTTRQCTGETQQFRFANNTLTPIARYEYVGSPAVLEVDSLSYR